MSHVCVYLLFVNLFICFVQFLCQCAVISFKKVQSTNKPTTGVDSDTYRKRKKPGQGAYIFIIHKSFVS